MASQDNQHAMLTSTDRKFLRCEGDYYTGDNAKQQRYDRRQNIRNRVETSLKDFGILFDHLTETERVDIFGEYNTPYRREFDNEEIREGVIDALAFLLRESSVADHMGRGRVGDSPYHNVMLEALRRVGNSEGYLVTGFDPDCIEAERMPEKELKTKLDRGDELSSEELRYLIEQEDLKSEVQEQLQERILEE